MKQEVKITVSRQGKDGRESVVELVFSDYLLQHAMDPTVYLGIKIASSINKLNEFTDAGYTIK